MTGFASLVRLFLRDLSRRRFVWGLLVVTLGGIGIGFWTVRVMNEAMLSGESWDIATRQQTSALNVLADSLRTWISIVVVLFAAQVAPESRRNGTTQFVLSLGVHRRTVAGAQFLAMAILLIAAVVLLHAGFSFAALRANAVTPRDVALGWISWVVPLMGLATAVFALSLTASAFESYLVFLGVPFLLRTLPTAVHGFPSQTPLWLTRALENLSLLIPDDTELVTWPHLTFGGKSVPFPEWHWALAQQVAAVAFWVTLGLWLYRRHDFGSRTALK